MRNSAVYAEVMPMSRTPDVMWACVGSGVYVHTIPGVTNCGASTPLTKMVLSSWTQAAISEPVVAIPATSESPAKTCPQTRFIGILQGALAHWCRSPVSQPLQQPSRTTASTTDAEPHKRYRSGEQSAKNVPKSPAGRPGWAGG